MYSLTLHPPSYVSEAILGNFSDTKDQQIVAACGSRLTLYRPDPRQGSISPVYSHDVFGIIRSLAAFRLPGSTKGTPGLPLLHNCLMSPSPRTYKLRLVRSSKAARSQPLLITPNAPEAL